MRVWSEKSKKFGKKKFKKGKGEESLQKKKNGGRENYGICV